MADLGAPASDGFAPAGTGPFGRMARGQYAALAAMRMRLFVNGLRSNDGVFELGARAIAFIVYGCMGLGLGVGAGVTAYSFVSRQMWQVIPIEFWVICFIWQAVSVALASFQEQFDLGGLLRFPIGFGAFYALCVLFGLVDASTLLGGLCSVGVLAGVTIARSDLFGWTALALAIFAAFNIFLVRAILAWIDRWLAKRRSREIVSAIFLLAVVSLQLLNPALHQPGNSRLHGRAARNAATRAMVDQVRPWVKYVGAVQAWLPPGLVAVAIEQGAEHEPAPALMSVGVLGLYALATGGLLAFRLRAEYRGENLGEAPTKTKVDARESGRLIGGAGPMSAVIEKDLRTLTRSMPQLYAVCVPVLMVFIIGSVFRNGFTGTGRPFQFALPICVAYGLLGFAQLMYNNLGPEGKGIQMLFLFPVPIRTVMLAKNLFHALLFMPGRAGLRTAGLPAPRSAERTHGGDDAGVAGICAAGKSGGGKRALDHDGVSRELGKNRAASRVPGQCAAQHADPDDAARSGRSGHCFVHSL